MATNQMSAGIRIRRMLGEKVQDRLRTNANPLVLSLRSRLGQPHVSLGRISIVVPIYNVDRFLRECLESIRLQSYPDIEVIMVNDGSVDSSEDIAREFARRDRRFKLITQENAGLGAARNTGIRASTGKYLTFVDSDDAVTAHAYREMVLAIEESGSDFVVGGVERWRSKAAWRDDWVTRVHGRDHLRATLDDIPEVTKDVFAWNKLFRADFFRSELGEFPEGILYEDQELTARAYTRCKSFDLLEATTYRWRMREDGTSITQGKLTERDLRDRIAVAKSVGEVYRTGASEEVYQYWKQKTAGLDFGFYYRLSHRGSNEYWQMLVEFTSLLFQTLSASDWSGVPVKERLLAALISSGDREQTERAINAQAQYTADVPTVRRNGQLYVDLSRWEVPQGAVPDFISMLYETDSAMRTGIIRIEWVEPGVLSISGFAYIDKIPASIAHSTLRLIAVRSDGVESEVTVERFVFDPDDLPLPRTSYAEHPESGIRARVDVNKLMGSSDAQLSLRVEMQADSAVRSAHWLPQNLENSFPSLPCSLPHGGVFDVRADRRDGVVVHLKSTPISLGDLTIDGRELSFQVTAHEPLVDARIQLLNLSMLKHVVLPLPKLDAGESVRVQCDLPMRRRSWRKQLETVWDVHLLLAGQELPVPYPSGSPTALLQGESGALAMRPGQGGWLELTDSCWAASVHHVAAERDVIRISGHFNAQIDEEPRLGMLRVDGTLIEQESLVIDHEDHEFAATFRLRTTPTWGVPFVPPTSGLYGLCMMPKQATDPFKSSVPLYFENRRVIGRRFRLKTVSGHAEVTDFGFNRSILIRLQGPLMPSEWNNTRQQQRLEQLREEAIDKPLLPRVALCMSFSGASVHDSPRPLAQQMLEEGLVDEIVWGVISLDQDPGDGARVVPVNSAEFIELLHRAKYLVNSAHFPHYFRKRDGQVYLQTWHGTPLKKIADDVPATSLSNRYRDLMSREVQAWDALLAQGTRAGELLAKAFGYQGPVLAYGYPRNDVLFDREEMHRLRTRFRDAYGVREDQKLVLYAPTWRDNSASGIAGAGFEELDIQRVLDAVGSESRMLLRGHSNTRRFGRNVASDRVLDVSGLSDLPSLFAASDLLITDYSSMFFDYDLTGKPVFGYAPDLETYASTTRGMYFEYADTFPGPIAETNDELVEILRQPPVQPDNPAPIVADVRAAEHGNASKQVVQWLRQNRLA